MRVLGLESSCDETAAAIVSFSAQGIATIESECVSSQIDMHALYGGVVPELAARAHLKNFPLVLHETFSRAGCTMKDIEYVAATSGPGLKGCLLMGVGVARGLAMGRALPLIPVNHIEGHILAALIEVPQLNFPLLALVVSGGHTELIVVKGVGEYAVFARTIDDACGEAFDKSANLLGLAYPGGPRLAALAEGADPHLAAKYFAELPRVMREAEGFSFSGLKTAISLLIKRQKLVLTEPATLPIRKALAAAIQRAIIDAIVFKVRDALHTTRIQTLVVSGGVAANKELRRTLTQEFPDVRIVFPRPEHCADNAAMIAFAGGMRAQLGEQGTYAPTILSRWPVEDLTRPMQQHS